MGRIKRFKKPRLHSEGRSTLQIGFVGLLLVNVLVYYGFHNISMIPFYVVASISVVLYAIVVNFFRCPIRIFDGETKNIAVAAADGKVVVIEEVDENEYFHDRRIMVSIFMSVTNVHANWYPVEGIVKKVEHHNGNFHRD